MLLLEKLMKEIIFLVEEAPEG
ncbi:hypothetical protein MNBD_NITROSPINAE04-46, partial [hydrothermal vent metagenome]